MGSKINKFEFEAEWSTWVGKKITKHSGKPFKSTLKIGTVNPNSLKPAFLMDDQSIVDCQQTKLL